MNTTDITERRQVLTLTTSTRRTPRRTATARLSPRAVTAPVLFTDAPSRWLVSVEAPTTDHGHHDPENVAVALDVDGTRVTLAGADGAIGLLTLSEFRGLVDGLVRAARSLGCDPRAA